MTKNQGQAGQLWKLTRDRPVTANVAVPSLVRGEGPSDVNACGEVNVTVVFADRSDAPGSAAEISDLKAHMTGADKRVQPFRDPSCGDTTGSPDSLTIVQVAPEARGRDRGRPDFR